MRSELVDRWRGDIVKAAYKVFSEKGYHAAKIADIAEELNIGHGTFYRYFRNKLDIFTHVIDDVLGTISAVVGSEDPHETKTLEEYRQQLGRIGNRLFDLFIDDERMSRLVFYEVLGITEELNEKVQQAIEALGALTEQYLVNGVQKGFLHVDLDTHVSALAVNAMIFEAVRRVTRAVDRQGAKERWTKAVSRLMLEGMRA